MNRYPGDTVARGNGEGFADSKFGVAARAPPKSRRVAHVRHDFEDYFEAGLFADCASASECVLVSSVLDASTNDRASLIESALATLRLSSTERKVAAKSAPAMPRRGVVEEKTSQDVIKRIFTEAALSKAVSAPTVALMMLQCLKQRDQEEIQRDEIELLKWRAVVDLRNQVHDAERDAERAKAGLKMHDDMLTRAVLR